MSTAAVKRRHSRTLNIKLRSLWDLGFKYFSSCTLIVICLLFVVYCPLENFPHMETLLLPVKGCKFWPMLDTHGHWAVRVLLWHGSFVYNGHLRGPVTFTIIAERLAVELSLPVLATSVCRGWDPNTQQSACGTNALTHCATASVHWSWDLLWVNRGVHCRWNNGWG